MNLVKRNLGWLLMSQMATWGVSIAILLFAPRELGDSAFGQLSFAMVYVGFFELVALFGSGTYLMKTIARDTETLGWYVFNTLVLKLWFTLFLIAAAIGLASALGYERETILLIAAYCLGMLFNSLNNALLGGLQGVQQMRRPALYEIVRSYVGGAAALLVLANNGTLLEFALVFNLACAIPLIGNFTNLWPSLRDHVGIDYRLWRKVMVGGLPFFTWSALLAFYGTIDIPLLKALSGSATVGWYALAYRWVSMPAFFAASVATAFFPALSAEGVRISRQFTDMANRAIALVLLVATPATVGIALIADSFIYRLYGTEFQQAIPLMRILALQMPIVGLDIILGSVLIAADRQRKWVMVGVAAAVINPLLNLALIPITQRAFDNGAIGAAAVTVLTELVLMVGAILLRPKGVLDGPTVRLVLRIGLASAAMVPVVLALGSAPLAIKIIAGALAYAVASIALKTVSLDEFRRLTGSRGRPAQATSAASGDDAGDNSSGASASLASDDPTSSQGALSTP